MIEMLTKILSKKFKPREVGPCRSRAGAVAACPPSAKVIVKMCIVLRMVAMVIIMMMVMMVIMMIIVIAMVTIL